MLKRIKNWFWPLKENNFQPFLLNDRAISVLILLFLITKVIFSFNLILVKQSSLFADISAQEITLLTNELREQFGLAPVKENALLNQAAKYKAEDMLKNSYFNHFSPTGISPWHWIDRAGYDYYYAGENLAMNFLDSSEVVQGWFNSLTHRENLLNKNYQEIGIAVISGDLKNEGVNRILVVQLFGSQKSKPTLPITLAQEQPDTPEQEISTPLTTTTLEPETETKPKTETEKKEVLAETQIEKTEFDNKITKLEITKPTESTQLETETSPEEITSQEIVQKESSEKQELDFPIISMLSEQQNILNKLNNNTRNQINLIDKIVAILIISFGLIMLFGAITQRQSIKFGFSELALRSFIIIILGISFATFQLENIIGRLII